MRKSTSHMRNIRKTVQDSWTITIKQNVRLHVRHGRMHPEKFKLHETGFPTEKKSSGRSHKNLNLAREQRNNMFTVARAIKKSKIFSLRHNKV